MSVIPITRKNRADVENATGKGPSDGCGGKAVATAMQAIAGRNKSRSRGRGTGLLGAVRGQGESAEKVPPYPISLVMINSGFISKLW